MKQIELEEIKRIELDILRHIKRVCEENNLRYFLAGGTLLGAVRHKGFIPWDDDIDISMPRPDYENLITLMEDNDKYMLLKPGDIGYYYNFAKVIDNDTLLVENGCAPIANMGVYIDIFPLDGMPEEGVAIDRHFAALKEVRTRINSFSFIKTKLRKNLYMYFKIINTYRRNNKKKDLISLQKLYTSTALRYEYDDSKYVYATGGAYDKKDIFLKNLFSDGVDVEFEGEFFKAPTEWDVYLRQLYGDYMQLPPIVKRISNHNYTAVYKYGDEV